MFLQSVAEPDARRFSVLRRLGGGSYGEVWLATDHQSGGQVAIKRIRECIDTSCDARMAMEELRILRHTRHPNIVKLLAILAPANERTFEDLHLVLEVMDTDLEFVIHRAGVQSLHSIQSIGLGILAGLKHLHSRMILHRDLKPANVLVSREGEVRLCDFGLSRAFSEAEWSRISGCEREQKRLRTGFIQSHGDRARASSPEPEPDDSTALVRRPLSGRIVTCDYRAPEVCLECGYSAALDVWSFGCVMAELCLVLADAHTECHQRRRLFERGPSEKQDGFPSTATLRAIVRVLGSQHVSSHFGWLEAAQPAALVHMRQLLAEPLIAAYTTPRIAQLMPGAPATAIELVSAILMFDPACRPSAAAAMKFAFFRDVASRCEPGGVWWHEPSPPFAHAASDAATSAEMPAAEAEEDATALRRMLLDEVGRCRRLEGKPGSPVQPTGASGPTPPSPLRTSHTSQPACLPMKSAPPSCARSAQGAVATARKPPEVATLKAPAGGGGGCSWFGALHA